MSIRGTLSDLTKNLSEENYDNSFAQYRFWLDVGISHAYLKGEEQVAEDAHGIVGWDVPRPHQGELIHPAIPLFSRFIRDAEADEMMCQHVAGLRRSFTTNLQLFFEENLRLVTLHRQVQEANRSNQSAFISQEGKLRVTFTTRVNLLACWANAGYMEEAVVQNRILQSLITHPKLYDHQADAIIILFKVAGATLGACADPSVVDRCFELVKDHYDRDSVQGRLVQEVVELRECSWKGLPPPGFTVKKLTLAVAVKEDPGATPVAASLGLPNIDPEHSTPRSPPLDSVAVQETEPTPPSPATQSPSISIASLSDFTLADTSDDEAPVDVMGVTRHDTFYLEDGNVEVLCGYTLFRVHTSILSFHSPALRRAFAQENLATAESPNGYPRILSSDAAIDFVTLLKIIYLPGFPERNKAPDFNTFSSLLRTATKHEMSTVRSQLFEIVRSGYPETFEELMSSKGLGEHVFTRPTPHPNEVLKLFIQQNLTSALPMAYYMAARRGLRSLTDRSLPRSATLSPEVLHSAIGGLMALREAELNETYRLILGSKLSHPCSSANCPTRKTTGPRASEAHQKVIDRIIDASGTGTRILKVLSLSGARESDSDGFCETCLKGWEAGYAGVRKRAWDMLPTVFGVKG